MTTTASHPPATGEVPKRRLGRTDEYVSVIGMGGFHIGHPDLPDDDAIKLIHAAIDRGITFLDNSWDYNAGMSEVRMGRALTVKGYRDRAFLMTKVDGRTKASFNAQFEESLNRLLTDHVDLIQFHETIRPDDADRIFAEGAFEAAIAARDAGKVRFIGFTGHKDPAYLVHMMECGDQHGFTFDTVQMPINVFDAHYNSFAKTVIPQAQKRDTAVLAMKTFGDRVLLEAGAGLDPIEMLQYGLSQPVSVVITGIDKPEILEQAIRAAATFAPLSQERIDALLAKTAEFARDGKHEYYKTTHFFDSTVQNPSWLG
jgi:aryl-alcohol dehydrogenase-like predicted oxidoreductase